VPKIQLSEVVKDFDDNFDYKNLIQFRDPDFLKEKYGEQLLNKFNDWFADEWYTLLGDAIYDNGDVHAYKQQRNCYVLTNKSGEILPTTIA
tara:strand:- start:479 stop:751 length:273 start_codon:yes stop_codon:yes gene_type:complete